MIIVHRFLVVCLIMSTVLFADDIVGTWQGDTKKIDTVAKEDKQDIVSLLSKRNLPKKLLRVSKKRTSDNEYKTYGLTGENKPNGIIYRFRKSKPADIPDFLSKKNYDIVDIIDNGWLALDRKRSAVSRYDKKGAKEWSLGLQGFIKNKRLEVQDIRYEDGVLYFNAVCIGYSSEENGECASLYAVNPITEKVLWNTPYLVSNNIFILEGEMIIAGYGFTAEPDYIFLIDKKSGEIVYKRKVDSAHNYFEVHGKQLHLITYKSVYIFDISP